MSRLQENGSDISSQEKEIIKKAYTEADPTTFSAIDLIRKDVIRLTRDEFYGIIKREDNIKDIFDDSLRDSYVELKTKEIDSREHFIALALKGVIHVSDIVYLTSSRSRKRLSKVMPIFNILPLSDSEIRADLALLHLLFGDDDHEPDSLFSGNLSRSLFHGQYAVFDFDAGFFPVFGHKEVEEYWRKITQQEIDMNRFKKIFDSLCNLYLLEGGGGFFRAIQKRSQFTLSYVGVDGDKLYQRFCNRIRAIEQVVFSSERDMISDS